MTEAEQINSHRADERSPSSGSATSRRRICNGERRRPARDRVIENAGRLREKSTGSAARKKVGEVERVQVELKETEMKRRSREGRRRDCTRNKEARALKRESPTGSLGGRPRPVRASLDPVKKTYSPAEAHYHWVIKKKNWTYIIYKCVCEIIILALNYFNFPILICTI
ncbi:hypothetical protein M9H77_12991 [Catharanthus roseus]|uniref:Uncharacterized protein n=1 Tax=Catharanthus roseus TaxID=4058 RepID=A0ACC0BJ63_CATRO|nr:hypothetical protein M9H77_12991 [Catharanthus roseus]